MTENQVSLLLTKIFCSKSWRCGRKIGKLARVSVLRSCGFILVIALLAGGCRKASNPAAGGSAGAFATQVVAVPVRAEPVSESVSLIGTVMPNEMVDLNAETDGIVKEVRFQEGEPVKKGDLLVALDDSKFAPQLAEAEAQLQLSKASFDRTRTLYQDKLLSQQEYDTASATYAANEAAVQLKRRELKDARILAPFSGITGARRISPGQVINKSTKLTELVDLDTVKVEVEVPERYLSQLKEGQKVEFRVAAFPKDSFKGEVYFISPQLNAGTRTALVKARIPNPDRKLRGGMFANLDLTLQLRDSALVIPEPAIINNGDATMVFAVTSTNTAVLKPVNLGLRLAGKVEVLSGLKQGEIIVVEGVQKLRPGGLVSLATNASVTPYLQ
ncbi:MAG TPA: hypothetical protein DCE44_03670 [Verrucomicrobiales bacterium]|nr:hypothetical protein [Verrucomicrobiales bacterium]